MVDCNTTHRKNHNNNKVTSYTCVIIHTCIILRISDKVKSKLVMLITTSHNSPDGSETEGYNLFGMCWLIMLHLDNINYIRLLYQELWAICTTWSFQTGNYRTLDSLLV